MEYKNEAMELVRQALEDRDMTAVIFIIEREESNDCAFTLQKIISGFLRLPEVVAIQKEIDDIKNNMADDLKEKLGSDATTIVNDALEALEKEIYGKIKEVISNVKNH